MRASQRLVIEAVYASWAAQDLRSVAACLHPQAAYEVHLPQGAWPIAGEVRGKPAIVSLLAEIVRDFEVLEYRPLKIVESEGQCVARLKLQYSSCGPRAERRRSRLTLPSHGTIAASFVDSRRDTA